MEIISLFSGCGGLDLGFKKAGFKITWANDNSKAVWKTYETNFPKVKLQKKSLHKIQTSDLPESFLGIIGGPPCQSWSNAGNGKGIDDPRGALFYDFIRILKDKKPLFFLAENVEGILTKRNRKAFEKILELLDQAGYRLSAPVLNAADFNVPQNRKRVIIVGYRKDTGFEFVPPKARKIKLTVKDSIWDLRNNSVPAFLNKGNKPNTKCQFPNHEYWVGGYSYIFMSRNRVLSWNLPAYTIQASGRQVSIHPSAPQMVKQEKDVMIFADGKGHLYRRLTIRECARIQSFPDDFKFHYDSLQAGYKMIGNAVPVNLAYALAKKIASDLKEMNYKRFKLNGQMKNIKKIGLKKNRLKSLVL